VRALPSFQLAAPTWTHYSGFTPQSGRGVFNSLVGMPSPDNPVGLVGEPRDNSKLALIHFGEVVASFRSLVKRPAFYCTASIVRPISTTYANIVRWVLPTFPLIKGQGSTLVSNWTASTDPAGFSHLGVLQYCYLAARGAIRWKVVSQPNSSSGKPYFLMYYRGPDDVTQAKELADWGPTTTDLEMNAWGTLVTSQLAGLGYGGGVELNPCDNGVEVESTAYQQSRWTPCNQLGPTGDRENVVMFKVLKPNIAAEVDVDFLFCSAAEDFTFLFFKGAPAYTVG